MFKCEFPPPDARLFSLARAYHERTEAYDRTVCTGPIGRDGILPATPREMGLINRNASIVMREILNEGQMLGFTLAELRRAIAHYDLPITDGSTHARKD
jgi:hypothetical protein